jgi:hypothetical protein
MAQRAYRNREMVTIEVVLTFRDRAGTDIGLVIDKTIDAEKRIGLVERKCLSDIRPLR